MEPGQGSQPLAALPGGLPLALIEPPQCMAGVQVEEQPSGEVGPIAVNQYCACLVVEAVAFA